MNAIAHAFLGALIAAPIIYFGFHLLTAVGAILQELPL